MHKQLYKKGKVIYIEGDTAEYFYISQNGWVKLFHQTIGGEEAIVDIIDGNNSFGEDAIFNNNRYTSSAEVVEDTELIMLPLSILKEQVNTNTSVAAAMLYSMSHHRKHQELEIEHLALQSAPQRIGCFLLKMCPTNKTSKIKLNLPYDKALIASRLGMKSETLSRALNTLRQEAGIRINNSTIEIDDIERLTNFTCTCSLTHPECKD